MLPTKHLRIVVSTPLSSTCPFRVDPRRPRSNAPEMKSLQASWGLVLARLLGQQCTVTAQVSPGLCGVGGRLEYAGC